MQSSYFVFKNQPAKLAISDYVIKKQGGSRRVDASIIRVLGYYLSCTILSTLARYTLGTF